MAKLSGTVVTSDIKGIREDLSDMIYDISPKKTPLMSSIGRGKAKNTLHEWQVDELAAPATNQVAEGNDAAFTVPTATVRLGNYCQISEKTAMVSGTVEAVDKAGRKSDLARNMARRSAELKRDIEKMLFDNIAASGSDPRKSAGLGAWLKTNVDYNTSDGVNPVYTTLPNDDRTDGTQRAFTKAMLDNVIQLAWTEGGEPDYISVGAYNKTKVSGFAGIADQVYNINSAKPGTIIATADVYVSDFGTLHVHANRFQRSRDAWVLDREGMSVDYLRGFKSHVLAKTGDAEKRLINVEYTLRVNNENAHGLIADLTTAD